VIDCADSPCELEPWCLPSRPLQSPISSFLRSLGANSPPFALPIRAPQVRPRSF